MRLQDLPSIGASKRKGIILDAPGSLSDQFVIKKQALDNGVRVVGVEMAHLHSVEVNVFIRGGRLHDGTKKWGASHLLEHIVLRGNKEYPDPGSRMATIGGGLNGTSGYDTISFEAITPPHRLDEVIQILSSLILDPVIAEEELETEKKIINHEILDGAEDMGIAVDDLIYSKLYPELELSLGSEPEIKVFDEISVEDIKKLHEQYVSADNLVVSIAGRFEFDEAVEMVSSSFAGISNSPIDKPKTGSRNPDLPMLDLPPIWSDLARLTITFCGANEDVSWPHMLLIDDHLIGGPDSKLFRELRQRDGLAYDFSSSIHRTADFLVYQLFFEFQPENSVQLLDMVFEAIDETSKEPLSSEELESMVEKRSESMYMLLDDTSGAVGLGQEELVHGEVSNPFSELKLMASVTPEEIVQYAGKMFDSKSMHVTLAGDYPRRRRTRLAEYFFDRFDELKLSKEAAVEARPRLFGRGRIPSERVSKYHDDAKVDAEV